MCIPGEARRAAVQVQRLYIMTAQAPPSNCREFALQDLNELIRIDAAAGDDADDLTAARTEMNARVSTKHGSTSEVPSEHAAR